MLWDLSEGNLLILSFRRTPLEWMLVLYNIVVTLLQAQEHITLNVLFRQASLHLDQW